MANTKVEVYNLALFNIGHTKRVASPTEDSIERQNCEAIYEQKKKSLLSISNWGFAKTEVALSLTGHTQTGWLYEYYYPNGCIKAIEIARASREQDPIPFQIGLRYDQATGAENRVILTNEANATLIYIRDVQSVSVMTPKFIDTLSHDMGIDLGRVMSKQKQVVDDMKSLFMYHLSEAIRMGEAEAKDEKELDAEWIRDR